MEYLIIFAILFIGGSYLLYLQKHERFLGLIFLIRTKHFISLIDRIAKAAPHLWNFLADVSVVFSFGGLGAAYLSDYRKNNIHLDIILSLSGVAAVLLWSPDYLLAVIGLIVLAATILSLRKAQNKVADFAVSSTIFTLLFIRINSATLTALGSEVNIPAYISVIQGGFGVPPLLLGMFLQQAYLIIFQGSETPGVSPMVPSVQEGEVGVGVPGYNIFVPIIYALIAFLVLLVSHEFAHGILARVSKVKIKSVGIASFGIIPIGAFVEPDEPELNRKTSIEKMRVYSAGSFANLLVCFISLTLMMAMSWTLVSSDGVRIIDVSENGTAYGILEKGMIIHSINGVKVDSITSYRLSHNITAGVPLTIGTDRGEYIVTPKEDPLGSGKAYIGIVMENNIKPNFGLDMGLINFIWTALGWIIFFNFNVALVNILPVAPFDGWRMLREIISVFGVSEELTKKIVYAVVLFGLTLLFINTLPLFGMLI